jgi:hypothetical protein
MSYKYRISDQEATHFLTFQIVGWVDIFTRKIYRDKRNKVEPCPNKGKYYK